jgi:hypothetical protein
VSLRGPVLLLLVAFLALVPAGPARADSWAAPQRTTYHSANRAVRLIVTPHIPADRNLWPFSQEPRGPSAPDMAGGVLQRRDERGRWRTQWQGQLRNPVMPVSALVADSGRYFVTFDDWGGTGTGPNAVVIYAGTGRVIRALSILDLLPEHYVQTLPASFSSIYWSGEHSFSADGTTLQLALALPGEMIFPRGYFPHPVTLATGEPGARAGAEWDRAMAASAAWRVAERERRAADRAFMTEPILPPRSADDEQWQDYLTEVFGRLVDRAAGVPMVILFRRPPAQDYVRWGGTPRAQLLSRNPSLYIAIASPDGLPLAPALEAIVAGHRPGWLRDVRLFIVADAVAWPELLRVMGPSGATLIQLDPAEPIPQRPERLPPNQP